MTLNNSYFEEPKATELEHRREEQRKKWRIPYDCFHAKLQGNKVVCAKGYNLRGKSSNVVSLLSVLRGISSSACKVCPDYENGEESHVQGGLGKEK